jgi:signal transduction histidine kinase
VWLANLASDPRFVRGAAAAECGLDAGFAFPVLVRNEVVAVLEFFYHELVPPNEDLLEVARHVGTQLGRVVERRHAEDALRITRMQQQALSRRLLEIQELERSRIARELHDQIGQVLTAVKLNLEATQQAHADLLRPADVAESLAAIDHAIEQVRTLSFELRPALLDDLGLAVAVGSYAKRQATKAGLDLHLHVVPTDASIRKEVETACFRILQEALTNVLRHAKARRVEVDLNEDDGVLELIVRDDGIGFTAEFRENPRSPYGRLGLLGMRERAQNVGGVFHVESQPTKGTLIRARLPLRASDRLERRGVARP